MARCMECPFPIQCFNWSNIRIVLSYLLLNKNKGKSSAVYINEPAITSTKHLEKKSLPWRKKFLSIAVKCFSVILTDYSSWATLLISYTVCKWHSSKNIKKVCPMLKTKNKHLKTSHNGTSSRIRVISI